MHNELFPDFLFNKTFFKIKMLNIKYEIKIILKHNE